MQSIRFLTTRGLNALGHSTPARTFTSSTLLKGALAEAIFRDHRQLEEQYNNILSAKDSETKTRWQNQFTWELARHSIGEEIVVYPAMEKYLTDGDTMADKDRAQHAKLKEVLYKFQSMNAAKDPDFDDTIKELYGHLQTHGGEEESTDVPRLEAALTDKENEDLASQFMRTKMFAPSRSHPHAPDKPPFETVAGLMAAPIDKLIQAFQKFPKQ